MRGAGLSTLALSVLLASGAQLRKVDENTPKPEGDKEPSAPKAQEPESRQVRRARERAEAKQKRREQRS